MNVQARNLPPLDPGFLPAVLWNRSFQRRCETEVSHPIAIALRRPDGTVSRFETRVLEHTGANVPLNLKFVERTIKFLLWSRGGHQIVIGGDAAIAAAIREM